MQTWVNNKHWRCWSRFGFVYSIFLHLGWCEWRQFQDLQSVKDGDEWRQLRQHWTMLTLTQCPELWPRYCGDNVSVRSSDHDTVTMSVSGVSWNVFVSGDQWWPVLTMWWLAQQCDDGGRWVVMISDNSRHLIRPQLSQHWSGYWQLITRHWALPLTLTRLLLCQTSIFQY